MRKAKIYGAMASLLDIASLALFIVGLLAAYQFFTVGLFSSGSKIQGVGQIALPLFGMWWTLDLADELDKAKDEETNTEYKQLVYSGLLAHGEDEHNAG